MTTIIKICINFHFTVESSNRIGHECYLTCDTSMTPYSASSVLLTSVPSSLRTSALISSRLRFLTSSLVINPFLLPLSQSNNCKTKNNYYVYQVVLLMIYVELIVLINYSDQHLALNCLLRKFANHELPNANLLTTYSDQYGVMFLRDHHNIQGYGMMLYLFRILIRENWNNRPE